MKKVIYAAALAALAAGCVSVNQNTGDDACLKQWVVKDVVHQKYSVDQNTVSACNQINCLFGWICWGGTELNADQSDAGLFGAVAKAKNGAYAKACEAAGCDQLAVARYKVTTEDYFVFKKIKAEVKGYPTKVVGVEVLENKTLAPAVPCKKGGAAPAKGGFGLF